MFNVLLNEPQIEAFIAYWNNALNFSHDYATRYDFWWAFGFNFLAMFMLTVDWKLEIVYAILTITPTFSMISRRYHDVGLSGWWQIIAPLDIIIAVWPSRKGKAFHRYHHQEV